MPGIEDWIGNPLPIVDSIFEQNCQKPCQEQVLTYFRKKISDATINMIPSMNDCATHELSPNSVVRFRCMIQDMYDPEYYLNVYEVKNVKSQLSSLRSGLFRDIAECSHDEQVLGESSRNVLQDRMTYYCISVPAEANWLNKNTDNSYVNNLPTTSTSPLREKRRHEDVVIYDKKVTDDNRIELSKDSMDTGESSGNTVNQADTKRSKVSNENLQASTEVITRLPNLNLPLPETENAVACLVKIYDNISKFRVNQVVEFVGVLSVDPSLASVSLRDSSEEPMIDEEEKIRHPPPSLVPRLHVIAAIPAIHYNPFIPYNVKQVDGNFCREVQSEVFQEILNRSVSIRSELHPILEKLFLDDALAADFMILHLLSTIYVRKDGLTLGKFALNFSNVGGESFPTKVHKIIEQFVTKSYYLPMSLSTMNAKTFIPEKDYTANRLKSGILQLSDSTHLVLDETALSSGQLDAKGVQNITALGHLIKWQNVEYSFNFTKMTYDCDIPVTIFSEGKSLLPCDFHIPLRPKILFSELESLLQGINTYLTPALLDDIRKYLTVCKQIEYTVSDQIQQIIQDDFVNMRRDSQQIQADDLHSLLIIARLISLSIGESSLSKESWEKAKTMEMERKQRLS